MAVSLKALSVRQPYAELMRLGRKTLEVRTWSTRYRGPLLIVSSSKKPSTELGDIGIRDMPLGCARCVVDLVDVRDGERDDAQHALFDAVGYYVWVVRVVRLTDPIPIKGKLSLYDVAMEV